MGAVYPAAQVAGLPPSGRRWPGFQRDPSRGASPRDRGAVAAEFALVMGLLALLIFVLVDVAVILNRQAVLVQAAREGVRRAIIEGGDTPEVHGVIRAQLEAAGLRPDHVLVSVTPDRVGYGGTLYVDLATTVRPMTPVVRQLVPEGIRLHVRMQGRNERVRPDGDDSSGTDGMGP